MSVLVRTPAVVVAAAAAAAAAALALAGCGSLPREDAPPPFEEESSSPAIRPGREPDALMIQFRETRGRGFSREGWEIEVLQMGSDVRIRGAVRTGEQVVPIYQPMSGEEYAEFWQWLRSLPLDGHQVRVDPEAAEAEWEKRLEIDVVLGPKERWMSKNTWTVPLQADDPVRLVEVHLHDLALDIAEREVARMQREATDTVGVREEMQRTLDVLGGGTGPRADPGSSESE